MTLQCRFIASLLVVISIILSSIHDVSAFLIVPNPIEFKGQQHPSSQLHPLLRLPLPPSASTRTTLYTNQNQNEPEEPHDSLPNKQEEQEASSSEIESNDKHDDNKDYYAQKIESIIDPIISNPLFGNFLFWLPFVANPKLRLRARTFLNENFDLTIAGPVTGVGICIATLYWIYSNRLIDIELATGRTEEALRLVRQEKMSQFLGNGASTTRTTGTTSSRPAALTTNSNRAMAVDADATATNTKLQEIGNGIMDTKTQSLKEQYEYALREELDLRLIQPGLKVPGIGEDPEKLEEKRAAARQFLGLDISEDGTLIPINGGR